ncbi:related to sensory transduction histidine kinase [Phialocephala subalpina]|uniref:Related to sensory transduction histidine kinase n=1 Tax=Phialocephala subalpina TaxID=576137 RepID=A0A1L7WVI2_9HELO|nr:related to sensory transduction histidine kinase [Phialocephala subalpina]
MENHQNGELALRARASKDNSKRKRFDWLSNPSAGNLTPFQKFIVDIDWANSSLGLIGDWPPQLRQMVLLIVQDPSPAVIYWGDEATIVYNEAYTELIGQKHPALQGQDPKIEFAEIWDHFEKLLAKQRDTFETVVDANAFLLLHRHGFYEETYFSWKFVPIIGPEGWVVGSHATVVEVTDDVIRERRESTVRNLSQQLAGAQTIRDLWSKIIHGIEDADKDMPLCLLYSIDDAAIGSRASSKASVKSPPKSRQYSEDNPLLACLLEGSTGIPLGHPVAATSLGSENEENWLVLLIKKAAKERTPVVSPVSDKVERMLHGLDWRGYGVQSTQVAVCPIIPADSDNLLAFLVVFLNPRRPYDEDYRNWLHLLTQQVTTPQLSAVILREEVERRQSLARLAALDRERLFRELTESETKFARFATRAPIGLAILAPDGTALSANDLWRDLTQLEVGTNRVNWEDVLADGQVEPIQKAWDTMLNERRSLSIQTVMRRPWQAPELDTNGNSSQWANTEILLAMHPDFDDDGEVCTVMSCITDISGLKWSESQLRRKMVQALEMKKQQERFIDMTSHEMRNPLSALIGCADEIIASLNDFRRNLITTSNPSSISQSGPSPSPSTSLHLISEAIEAADTIIYCAMHQKRIIDDILTLSRLDANLLVVSPEPCQPISLIRSALKMFEAELKRASTSLSVIEEPSLKSLSISWTLLDPSRVLQVLINLMTNAIKFTRTENKREIKITTGASLTKPSEKNAFGVQYVRKSNAAPDQTSNSEWGDGELIFLCITVEDTGRGLDSAEIKNLFHLFAQASPKTHQTYGGSGLGLFISRQLVEMQGGEIGVASQAGKGSTFQFYVKTRRTSPSSKSVENGNAEEARGGSKDFQLLVREDALREACAVEVSALQNGTKMPNLEKENIVPLSPRLPKEKEIVFHILVVEDNLVNQKVVSKQLRKAGHVVEVANHGEEALAFLRRSEFWSGSSLPTSNPPQPINTTSSDHTTLPNEEAEVEMRGGEKLSVILMDLEMPVMDGIECVKTIRTLQEEGRIRGHVPIIAVTANARKDRILRSLEAGMDDVTTKPYRINDMLKQIEKLVAKHTSGAPPLWPIHTHPT